MSVVRSSVEEPGEVREMVVKSKMRAGQITLLDKVSVFDHITSV